MFGIEPASPRSEKLTTHFFFSWGHLYQKPNPGLMPCLVSQLAPLAELGNGIPLPCFSSPLLSLSPYLFPPLGPLSFPSGIKSQMFAMDYLDGVKLKLFDEEVRTYSSHIISARIVPWYCHWPPWACRNGVRWRLWIVTKTQPVVVLNKYDVITTLSCYYTVNLFPYTTVQGKKHSCVI